MQIKETILNIEKNKHLIPFVQNIVEESGCRIVKTEWRSTYNSYVVYDYEPFCSDGFSIQFHVSGRKENINFVKHLFYERYREVIPTSNQKVIQELKRILYFVTDKQTSC